MEALLQTLLGGFLALAGTFAAPYFQRKHERWLANRDDENLMREKAQELFDELDRFVRESRSSSLSVFVHMTDKTAKTQPMPDLGRVWSIAAIYFPTSLTLISSFEKKYNILSEFVGEETKKALDDKGGQLSRLEALPMIISVKHQEFAANFVTQMRSHLAINVPEMKLGK